MPESSQINQHSLYDANGFESLINLPFAVRARGSFVSKLYRYMLENNPDLLLELDEYSKVEEYFVDKIRLVQALTDELKGQPKYLVELACMYILTQDLRPSKFNYVSNILEEEFEETYQQIMQSGVLMFEVINLVNKCKPVFDVIPLTEENEDNRQLRYAIIGTISEYIESSKWV